MEPSFPAGRPIRLPCPLWKSNRAITRKKKLTYSEVLKHTVQNQWEEGY